MRVHAIDGQVDGMEWVDSGCQMMAGGKKASLTIQAATRTLACSEALVPYESSRRGWRGWGWSVRCGRMDTQPCCQRDSWQLELRGEKSHLGAFMLDGSLKTFTVVI